MSVNQDREAWLLDKRAEIEMRYDRVFSQDYDLRFSLISDTHRTFMETVAATLDEDCWVLDVGCGTGKHWDTVFASGARVVGVDISAQMLQRAKEKYPFVTLHHQPVQELAITEVFDSVLFVDVFDGIGPEDWPLTLKNLLRSLKRGGILYFTAPSRPADANWSDPLRSPARGEYLPFSVNWPTV
jgi:SAM-dependent methyltransferase